MATPQTKIVRPAQVVLVEYMELLVNSNGLDKETILTTCANILEQIKNIGMPKNDSNITTMIHKIEKLYNTNDCDNISGDELCGIFKFIIELLEELQRFYLNKMIDEHK